VHKTARALMKRHLDAIQYVYNPRLRVLDAGSHRGGAYRRMAERKGWDYTGLDTREGANVDVVTPFPCSYPFDDDTFDVVISGSTMEHVPDLRAWVNELARVLRPAGWLIVLTVNEWPEHKHPLDCWRILPDGMRYLFDMSLWLQDYEIYTSGRDTVGAARKRIDWLSIKGSRLIREEREWLRHTAYAVSCRFGPGAAPPINIVNIGVKHGASMYCLRGGAKYARMLGVDTDISQAWVDDNLRALMVQDDSAECYPQYEQPVHFLLIDGDRHGQALVSDLNWVEMVVPGGIVAFRDYAPSREWLKALPHLADVKTVVDEWFAHRYEDWQWIESRGSIAAFRRLR